MALVQVILGSRSDLSYLRESELLPYLAEQGISTSVNACSAHRNSEELRHFIAASWSATAVYVCAAGWSAALPGAVRANLLGFAPVRVLGIALPSEEYPDGEDAAISITRLPPGIEVTYCGVGTPGFNAAVREVCDIVAAFRQLGSHSLRPTQVKPPEFNISLSALEA